MKQTTANQAMARKAWSRGHDAEEEDDEGLPGGEVEHKAHQAAPGIGDEARSDEERNAHGHHHGRLSEEVRGRRTRTQNRRLLRDFDLSRDGATGKEAGRAGGGDAARLGGGAARPGGRRAKQEAAT